MINQSDNVLKLNSINRRMFILAAAKVVILGGIVSRLFFLQVKENKRYLTLSDKNRIREWKLPPIRGNFEDYFGNTIAGNFEAYELHLIPEEIENFRYTINRVRNILQLSDSQFQKILKKKNQIKPWENLIVSNNLTWENFSKINNNLYDLNGVKPVISISRSYPFKENFTHVLGYVSQANDQDIFSNEIIKEKFVQGLKVGKIGLEKTFENDLIGNNSIERYEVNAYGRRISQLEFQKGKKGKTIKLTIDTEIQKLANELLKEKAGSICVMDIFTGDVVAMHSSPSFDANKFVFGISNDDWQLIRNDPMKPLVNKSLSGNYSPGSTIKPIVALSALENKVVNSNFKVNCRGHKNPLKLYGQTYHCWKKEGHGIVNMREAMKESCDTYFYEVARRLGVDKLSDTAKKFGLGKKVFGDLFEIEKSGLIPSTFWKKNALGRNWLLGETIITGIGQGYIQTTPIQLCLMTAQIANGGHKIIPKIILDSKSEEEDKFAPIVEDAKNMKLVQDAMFSSTNEVRGTSYRSRIDDPKYQFAGKTGTAQVKRITKQDRELDLDTSEIPYEERDHALYVAFGPYKNPRYAASIVIEHGGSGGSVAAPLAKKLFKKIIDRHEIRKNFESNKYLNI
ncbi:penicillin-binding protein 2 [Candidatus Pelagibacter sp. HIMB1321]|uniref:penicillin-binding protein 2 n=1 Tax=Candidatus Pelagibacter sp. HIMB1321 TaxID=1388755 RepID=UPI000A0815E2|nr:penicillin-binding protein 2 [Candidatus Pelagibacter sp. HIMB1321]SMF78634.1 peptidoglycan glycosyltransferase [Candidatus Pelagibacter sp. HIMB1321]